MELFKITCVTCQAGLSVRNKSIIGQIVACPQCGSMVQVVSPGEPEAMPAEAGSPARAGPPVPLVESTAPEPITPDSQTVAAVASYGWIAWTVAILVVGATLVGTVLFWTSEPKVSDAAPPRATEQPESTEAEEPSFTESAAAESPPITPAGTETETPEKLPSVELSALPPDEIEVREKETVVETLVQEAKPQSVVAPVDEPRVARRFDPLDLDPEGLDLASLNRMQERNAADTPVRPSVVDDDGTVSEVSTSTLPIVRRGSDPKRDIGASEAQEQLARRLPALKVRSMRLVDFFSLVSQLSGSPVSVGPEQLQMAGISPRKQISLDARDIRLDEALARVLEPLRLEYVVDGEQVIVIRKDAAQVREIKYPIDDLVSSASVSSTDGSSTASAEQLADWVRQLVVPASWQEATLEITDGSLRIEQSQQVHYQVLVFLERLRLVRGLPTRSRYPVERLAPTPLHAAMAKRLTAPAMFTFSRETPLSEVFLHWQRELDLPLLIDWPALAEAELWPNSTVFCAVADCSWHEAFTRVLEPLGLDWRAVAGGAIEISSAERLQRDLQLELYPLLSDESTEANQILNGLRGHVSKSQRDTAAQSKTELILDPTAPAVLALQPATAHREILAWLIEQGLFRQP